MLDFSSPEALRVSIRQAYANCTRIEGKLQRSVERFEQENGTLPQLTKAERTCDFSDLPDEAHKNARLKWDMQQSRVWKERAPGLERNTLATAPKRKP